MKIKSITIFNYKSIKYLNDFKLQDLNILIGSNGAGKSNFISFLNLLRNIAEKNLQVFIASEAGANNLLHFGRKVSSSMGGQLFFDTSNAYDIELTPNDVDSFFFTKEVASFMKSNHVTPPSYGYSESKLDEMVYRHKASYRYEGIPGYVSSAMKGFEVYHFHDTGKDSPLKQSCNIHDNQKLHSKGKNLASILFLLKNRYPTSLKLIEGVVRQAAPFFKEFVLEPLLLNPDNIRLEWKPMGADDTFSTNQLSDGTLRFIALTTLLLQPTPPATIIIDEPELGLHPAAIGLLSGLLRKASTKSQIIVSTQSVTLLNQFNPQDIIVVDRKDNCSVFRRVDEDEISTWLSDYSIGEAWEKNIIGGRP